MKTYTKEDYGRILLHTPGLYTQVLELNIGNLSEEECSQAIKLFIDDGIANGTISPIVP
jgi:hypothetical protein